MTKFVFKMFAFRFYTCAWLHGTNMIKALLLIRQSGIGAAVYTHMLKRKAVSRTYWM